MGLREYNLMQMNFFKEYNLTERKDFNDICVFFASFRNLEYSQELIVSISTQLIEKFL